MALNQLTSDRFNLHYISIVPKSTLYSILNQIIGLLYMLLFLSFFIGLITAFFTTKYNQNKINLIIKTLEHAKDHTFRPAYPAVPKDEYDYICNNIIQTFLEQNYLKLLLTEKKYRLRSMELIALQPQINPHFLFNTLKTIYCKSFALSGTQNQVSEMVENLSAILDYSLSSPKDDAQLSYEIPMVESYLDIQSVRYPNKFVVIWNISAETLSTPVVKLILQPIIENSIYHGICKKDGVCKIKAFQRDSFIYISITDTGLGMSKEQLVHVRAALQEDHQNKHIGLQNTYKRLSLQYEGKLSNLNNY